MYACEREASEERVRRKKKGERVKRDKEMKGGKER